LLQINQNIDEIALIKGCKNNDRKSQERLYKLYFNKMYLMCQRYTQDEDTICAIINDAYLSVFKNIEKFEARGSLEGWVRRITFNTMADYFRKRNKEIKFLNIDDHDFHLSDASAPLHDYDDIISKIETLTGSIKEVFVKYAIEGYSHKEIGEYLHISEGTSKWYLSEARKKLQALIKYSNNTNYQYGK
jgi:RNA polymerase sigma factor (sigma-70 family)